METSPSWRSSAPRPAEMSYLVRYKGPELRFPKANRGPGIEAAASSVKVLVAGEMSRRLASYNSPPQKYDQTLSVRGREEAPYVMQSGQVLRTCSSSRWRPQSS